MSCPQLAASVNIFKWGQVPGGLKWVSRPYYLSSSIPVATGICCRLFPFSGVGCPAPPSSMPVCMCIQTYTHARARTHTHTYRIVSKWQEGQWLSNMKGLGDGGHAAHPSTRPIQGENRAAHLPGTEEWRMTRGHF